MEDCVISCDYHLAQSEFSRSSKFPNGCLVFLCFGNNMHKHVIGTKDATKFGVKKERYVFSN